MKITTKRFHSWKEVTFKEGSATIDLGLLNLAEQRALAKDMLNAIYEMGPSDSVPWMMWFTEIAHEAGIEVEATHA